jgi:hypothetical protein
VVNAGYPNMLGYLYHINVHFTMSSNGKIAIRHKVLRKPLTMHMLKLEMSLNDLLEC